MPEEVKEQVQEEFHNEIEYITDPVKDEWRVIDGKMHPDHVKFVEEQSKINESLISEPESPKLENTRITEGDENNTLKLSGSTGLIKRKRGRPPKQKNETAVEPKKELELPQKEDVEVPEKRRFVDPLKLKDKKIKPIKKLDEVIKPSKGDEVIALIENLEKEKDKESIIQPIESVQKSQESLLIPPELLTPYMQEKGVEVIDVRAVPMEPEKQREPGKVNKFGIPIQKGENLNFDRI